MGWGFGNRQSRKQGEVKWQSILRQNLRDIVLMGFGGWVIWTEVYTKIPNGYLILVGFGCMVPSARAAIISILSEPGSSSGSSHPPSPPPSQSSPPEDAGDG
jgi:hypothetical protein